MGFLGHYADLTGYRLGNKFTIVELAGRDHSRAPLWRVRCESCSLLQPFPHAKLAAAIESGRPEEVIFCTNQGCTRSRVQTVRTETLSDIRRREQQQYMEAQQEAARREAEQKSQTEREARIRAEKARWMMFANSQIAAGLPLQEIMSFAKWRACTENWRTEVLRRIEQQKR